MKRTTYIKTTLITCCAMLGVSVLSGCESVEVGKPLAAARGKNCSDNLFHGNFCYVTSFYSSGHEIFSSETPSTVADDIYVLDAGIMSGMLD